MEGHLLAVSIKLKEYLTTSYVTQIFSDAKQTLSNKHFIAPNPHIVHFSGENRPQPILDSLLGNNSNNIGMQVGIGRVRVKGKVLSFFVLTHNTIRGGAGGSVLNAELAYLSNLLTSKN